MLDDHPRPGAAEDGAVFAPVRVKGTRRPQMLAALVIVAVGGLVAIGALDRGTAPPQTAAIADGTDAPAATPPTPTLRSSRPPRASTQVPGSFEVSGGPDRFIDLDVRPAGSHLFIHGDVFSIDVIRVRVKLTDSAGNVAATKSVDIPGGSTAFRIGAVPRFDVHFLLADEVQADGFIVTATALDSGGRSLESLLQLVPPTAAM